MRMHIYKIEEDRIADCSEIYVYGAFSVDEARRKAEFVWRYLTESERKHASISAQGFDLDTNALPESLLDDLGLERDFDPHNLSDEELSTLLAAIDENLMLPPFDVVHDILELQ